MLSLFSHFFFSCRLANPLQSWWRRVKTGKTWLFLLPAVLLLLLPKLCPLLLLLLRHQLMRSMPTSTRQ